MNESSRESGVLLGLCLLTLGLFFSHGLYQAYWLWTLPAAAIAVLFSAPPVWFKLKLERYLPSLFLLVAAEFVTRGFGQLGNVQTSEPDREWLIYGFRLLYFSASICAYFCLSRGRAQRTFFGAAVLFVSFGLVLLLFASPRPWIDVWTVQEAAATALLHGKNPYGLEYLNIYPATLQPLLNPYGNPFVYLPGVLYLFAPVKWIGLDTRVALVLAHTATTFLLGAIPNRKGYLPALLLLTMPFVPYLIDQAWNDSFTVMFIALCAFALQRKSFAFFVASLVGMSLIKQHVFLVMPLLIYFGSRHLDQSPFKTTLFVLAGFVVGCLPFALWNWSAFIGSLWGLHALTHTTGPIIPDRLDGFSLLNWLTLNSGFRPYSFFILAAVASLAFAFTVKRKTMELSSLFAISAVALLGVFALAPLAFLNYYWVCIGLLTCAMCFEWKPVFKAWPSDVIVFTMSRCLLLFSTQFFQSQTTFYNFFAAEKLATVVPIQAFGYRLMPLSQLPMAVAGYLKSLSSAPPLLSFRLYFVLLLVAADFAFYFSVRKRCARANLYLYAITSAVLFEQFYDHVELWAGLALAFGLVAEGRSRIHALSAGVAFAFQWTAGIALAVSDCLFRKDTARWASLIAITLVALGIAVSSPMPLAQFFERIVTEPNATSITNFIPFGREFFAMYELAVPMLAFVIALAVRIKFGNTLKSAALALFTFMVFDPLAGTGALVLVLPCLALIVERKTGSLLILSCALRTLEFHHIMPAYGASQFALALTYLAFLFTSDWRSKQPMPFQGSPSPAL